MIEYYFYISIIYYYQQMKMDLKVKIRVYFFWKSFVNIIKMMGKQERYDLSDELSKKYIFVVSAHQQLLSRLTLCCVDTSFRSWYHTWERSLKHKVEYLRASPIALQSLSKIEIGLDNIFLFRFINTKCWCDIFTRNKMILFNFEIYSFMWF